MRSNTKGYKIMESSDCHADAGSIAAAYGAVPYAGTPKPLAHPERLAVLGRFAGLDTADPSTGRVLEIGCGNGAHLTWVASTLPGARCVGLDLAQRGIDTALRLADAACTPNVRFAVEDVSRFEDEAPFDFIIMHGVYTWVPHDIRAALLQACARLLSPRGLAFVSYNVQPGCRMRQLVRDMMTFHAGATMNLDERLRLAREAAPLVRAAVADEASTYSKLLAHEIERLSEYPDFLLFHDELSPHYEPILFSTFVADARAAGLDYLADSQRVHRVDELPVEFIERLGERASDPIALEQYTDFVRGRTFRQSILCRPDAPRLPQAVRGDLDDLRASAEFTVVESADTVASEPDSASGQVAFEAPGGVRITLGHPALVSALRRLVNSFPRSVAVAALLADAAREDWPLVTDLLVRLFDSGLLGLQRGDDIVAKNAEDAVGVYPFALATLPMGYVCTPRGRYFELKSDSDAERFREVDRTLRTGSAQVPTGAQRTPGEEAAIRRLHRSGLLVGNRLV